MRRHAEGALEQPDNLELREAEHVAEVGQRDRHRQPGADVVHRSCDAHAVTRRRLDAQPAAAMTLE